MTLPRTVRIVASAAQSIEEAAEWWAANRTKAPGALIEDIEKCLNLIAAQPGVGARARNIRLSGVRRIHIARIRHHLYYRIVSDGDLETVEVLAFWHASRGIAPKL